MNRLETIPDLTSINDRETRNPSWPQSVDINPTARCQLGCSYCWGESHTLRPGLTPEQWCGVIAFFAQRGTQSLIVTGGEPLLYRGLSLLLETAKAHGIRTTLSTNAILLPEKQEYLKYVDDIGVSVDSANEEGNASHRPALMRVPRSNFAGAQWALDSLRTLAPHATVTVRTVVTKNNIADVTKLADFLHDRRAQFDRWKVYKFVPAGGYGKGKEEELGVTSTHYADLIQQIQKTYPQLPLTQYDQNARSGRYLFVGTRGDVWTVGDNGINEISLGNFLTDSDEQLEESITYAVDPYRNSLHGLET